MQNETEIVQGKVTVVIGVPGSWPDRATLGRDIITKTDARLLVSGNVLIHAATGHAFEIDIYPHDPNLAPAFKVAGSHWITQDDLKQIEAHTQTVYLLGPGGNLDNAREMMQVANGLLDAGGIAVKVESTGKASSRTDWAQMTAGSNPLLVYDAYVVFAYGDNTAYSCGMHVLGYQDAIIASDLPPDEAVALLDIFLKYLLVEQPALSEGHTFSVAPDAPDYRLELETCSIAEPDDLFYNPFGVWRLIPE